MNPDGYDFMGAMIGSMIVAAALWYFGDTLKDMATSIVVYNAARL